MKVCFMSRPEPIGHETDPGMPTGALGPSFVSGVLARLPEADRQRTRARRRQIHQRLGATGVATVLLLTCLGPQSSNIATRALAWLLGAGAAWHDLVAILLGGVIVLPALSALSLVAVSLVLWQQFLHVQGRHLR
jgi:hypothetical protein